MVARRVPLTRRLKAWSGAIFSGLVWLIAATISGGLYLLDVGKGDTLVVARIQSVPIRVPESGRISSVSVKTGDHVEAGQILAVLEIPGLQQEIGAATATLEAARGGLSNQTNDRSRRYQTDVADARANYLSANVALKEQQARLAELELEYRRVTAPGVALPVAEVEGVTARREAARALVDAQQKELDGLKSSLDQAISRAGGMMDPQVQAQNGCALPPVGNAESPPGSCNPSGSFCGSGDRGSGSSGYVDAGGSSIDGGERQWNP